MINPTNNDRDKVYLVYYWYIYNIVVATLCRKIVKPFRFFFSKRKINLKVEYSTKVTII